MKAYLKVLSFALTGARLLTRQRLVSLGTTSSWGRQSWFRTIVVKRTLQAAVYRHSGNHWSIGTLRTGDWSEALQRTVETYVDAEREKMLFSKDMLTFT